jgi:DNA-binding MarR family transcriptional regulator
MPDNLPKPMIMNKRNTKEKCKELREYFFLLWRTGYTQFEIAKFSNYKQQTVSYHIKKYSYDSK